MSVVPENVRLVVERRAGFRCEYCHLPTRGQIATFPIDHVLPRIEGGPTELGNLALACPACNGSKWKHINGIDPTSGQIVPLFDPRTECWNDHFAWSSDGDGELEGRTPCGRATIDRLQVNRADLVATRKLLAALGIFPDLLA